MTDHIKDIEDKQGQIDLGVMSARVFEGALQESGSLLKAYFATSAFWRGSLDRGPTDDDNS